jgi:hydroxymethylbilane synthase
MIIRKRSADAAGLGNFDGAWISGRELAAGGPMIVGTSSLRRAGLLAHHAPKIKTAPLRGNVDSRLRKLAEGAFDGIILAGAAMDRLGQSLWQDLNRHDFVISKMNVEDFTPCAGQGALAIETANHGTFEEDDCQSPDAILADALSGLNCPETDFCVQVERHVLQGLGGDCTMPFGALCVIETMQDNRQVVKMAAKILDRQGNQATASLDVDWSEGLSPGTCGAKLLNAIADDGAAAILTALELPVPESMRLH